MRDYGLDHRALSLRRVSDFDGDAVDELWLGTHRGQLVVTFSERGEWVVLGDLPGDCVERSADAFRG